ncbi:MAG TPA: hypothetical protein VF990_16655 [Candidatus Dormibacteraeota bacterium]
MILAVAASAVLGHQLGLSTGTPSAVTPKRLVIADPYAAGGTWYKGNLHVASVRGVGKDLPSAIGAWYVAHGYAFLGISDMNTYTWASEYGERALPALPTVDATYPFAELLAVGMDHWQPANDLKGAIDWIVRDGGLPVLAAPGSAARPQNLATVLAAQRLFGLEIYDARLADSNPGQQDATAMWDRLLSAGNRVYAFAGDDATSLNDPALGRAWIEVLAPAQDVDSLLSSLREGAFIASTGAEFTRLHVAGTTITADATSGTSLRFIGRGGQVLKAVNGSSGTYQIRGDEGYVRVEATAPDGAKAWSQPFFISWR